MAVELRLWKERPTGPREAPDGPPPLEERLVLTQRRRRLQKLQQSLVTAGWVGAATALLLFAAAGVLGLH